MVKIEHNVNLAKYTTLGVGGTAKHFARAGNKADLLELLQWASGEKLAVAIIGGGSNLLISDTGYPGLVILNRAVKVDIIHDSVTVESGMALAKLAKETQAADLTGLEWTNGIPGTVGGAVVGNAGALGGQIADVLVTAEVFVDGTVEIWHNADFEFDYRKSKLKGNPGVYILSATFKLLPIPKPKVTEKEGFYSESEKTEMVEADKERRLQSYKGKTAGSYFKNPDGFTAAELIDRASLKGYRIGDAEVSTDHANVFRNLGNATATDIYKLEKYVTKTVQDKFGVTLIPEVVKLGKF